MAIFCHTWYARGETYRLGGIPPSQYFVFFLISEKAKWDICSRTRDESDPSAGSTQQQTNILIQPPTRDHEQSGRNYFVFHIAQTGALASG